MWKFIRNIISKGRKTADPKKSDLFESSSKEKENDVLTDCSAEKVIKSIQKRLSVLEWGYGLVTLFLLIIWCGYIFHQKVVEKIYWERECENITDQIDFVRDIFIIGVLIVIILFLCYQFIAYTRLKNRYVHSEYVLSLIKFAGESFKSDKNGSGTEISFEEAETFENEKRKIVRASMDSLIKAEIASLEKERKREWLLKMLES